MLNNTEIFTEKSDQTPTADAPINIWLVDDNKRLRNAFTDLLDQFDGLKCTGSFHSPNAVLSALASKRGPDVILLDIQMGNACGLDAIQPIKSLSRSTQVLMLTTCFDPIFKMRARDAGASGFLLKHFPINRIVNSIQHAAKNPTLYRKKKARALEPDATVENAETHSRAPWVQRCLELLRNHCN